MRYQINVIYRCDIDSFAKYALVCLRLLEFNSVANLLQKMNKTREDNVLFLSATDTRTTEIGLLPALHAFLRGCMAIPRVVPTHLGHKW
jgi:hypothetical protein